MRIAVIDDEKAVGMQIESFVKEYCKIKDVPAEIVRYEEAVSFLENYSKANFDAVFLDIKMPKMNGLRAAELLRQADDNVIIVFITNLKQFAIKGYSVDATGFVVKPIDEYDFNILMDKIVRIHNTRKSDLCTVNTVDGICRVKARDIHYIEVIKHKLIYHTVDGDINSWGSLVTAEKTLPQNFSRCNVCYLVNLQHVQAISGEYVKVAGTPLKIARSRKKEFIADLARYGAAGNMFDFSSSPFWYKLWFMTELLIAEGLSTYTLKKRNKFGLRVALSVVALYVLAFLFPIFAYNALYSTLMFFLFFSATIFALRICYDESWLNILFCALLAYTVQHIAYELSSLVALVLDMQTINVYLPNENMDLTSGELAINAVVVAVVFALVYWFVWAFVEVRIRRQTELVLGNFYLIFWVFITLVIDIVFSAVIQYTTDPISKIVRVVFILSNIVACVLSIGYQVLMLDRDNTQRDLIITEQLWKKDKERFDISKEAIELLNVKCHDLKSQISALRNYNGFIDESTLIELENTLSVYGVNIKTGNDALDVILAEKSILCENKDIKLSCMIDGGKLGFMSSVKLYSLFGNALQNAIESTN